jgi:carbon monoxide dehydrogenase subunit G
MDMTGEYRIPAPRQRVWEALNDPEILKASIPGCEDLKKVSDRELEARVKAKVGPVSATFNGKVTLADLNPPESYTISGEGKGGAAGFARGGAAVNLAEDGADTLLRYQAKAEVGGKLAQIGSRLVQSTAKKMADEFFGKFSAIVTEREGGVERPPAAPPPAGPVAVPGTAEPTAQPPEPTPPPEVAPAPQAPPPPPAPETSPAAVGMAAAATGTPTPTPPRPKQVAFTPERPPAERKPAPAPAAPAKGPLQQWWVWAIVLALLAFLLYYLLGSGGTGG